MCPVFRCSSPVSVSGRGTPLATIFQAPQQRRFQSATSSSRSPQRGHARTSKPKLRCINSAHSQLVRSGHVAPTMRQTQDPRPHGHDRKHVIDEICRAVGHAPPATARTDCPPLTGKRYEAIEPAPAAVKPGEPTRQEPERRNPWNSSSINRGSGPLVDAGGLGPERLEMIAHHLVQHALCGRLWRVGWGGTGTSGGAQCRVQMLRTGEDPPIAESATFRCERPATAADTIRCVSP